MSFVAFMRANAPFLLAGFLLSLLSTFGQTTFIAIFAGEIRAEFGLSHAEWGSVYAAGTLASAFVMLWAGALTDRFRIRALGAWVLVALAGACLGMAVNPWAAVLPVVIFALRFLGQGMLSHLAGVAMARWFVALRGRALAVAALGFSTGEVLLPLSFVALKQVADWRLLWAVAACLLLAMLPVLSHLLRLERTPQSMAQESATLGMGGRHWTRGQALRHPLFWMIMPAMMVGPVFATAFFFQQVHLAEAKGWSHVALVAIFPVYTGAAVAAVMLSGWAIDRFGAARIMPFYPLGAALFYLVFPHVQTLGPAAVAVVMLGVSSGAQATVPSAFWAEAFGTRHIGAIRAIAGAVLVLGSAIGPVLTGVLIDAGISFPRQMPAIGIYVLAAVGLAALGVARARPALSATAKVDVIGP